MITHTLSSVMNANAFTQSRSPPPVPAQQRHRLTSTSSSLSDSSRNSSMVIIFMIILHIILYAYYIYKKCTQIYIHLKLVYNIDIAERHYLRFFNRRTWTLALCSESSSTCISVAASMFQYWFLVTRCCRVLKILFPTLISLGPKSLSWHLLVRKPLTVEVHGESFSGIPLTNKNKYSITRS